MNWIIIWNLNEYGLSQCNTNFLHMYLVCCESPQVTSVISPLLLLLLPEPPHQATTNLLPLRPVPPWPTPTLPTPPSFRPLSLHPRLKGKILAKCLNQIEGTWTQGHPDHAHSVHSAADAWLFLSPSLSSLQASFHGSSSHSSQS